MKAVEQCPICNGISFKQFLTCEDFTVSHETFNLVKCEECKLVITSPQPILEELGKYYLSQDYISHSREAKGIFDKVYQISRRFALKWKLDLVKEFSTPLNSKLRLLDFGCGTGDFLNTCYQSGFDIKGVEPSIVARNNTGSQIQQSIHASIEEIKEEFDVITIWHVLEHVPDLNTTLEQLQNHLRKNGTVFIAVPNHQSKDAMIYQNLWAGYDVPRHLWHFTQETMSKLLNAHNLKLQKVIPMKLDSFYVSMLSEKHKRRAMTISGLTKGFLTGLTSNISASQTTQYSSLIYVIRK